MFVKNYGKIVKKKVQNFELFDIVCQIALNKLINDKSGNGL